MYRNNTRRNIPGDPNATNTSAINNGESSLTAAGNEGMPATSPSVPSQPRTITPDASAGFSHSEKTIDQKKITTKNIEKTEKTSSLETTERSESSEITITKITEIKERLSSFKLLGGMLQVDLRDSTGVLVKRQINLDDYLGFAEDGSLSWEETGFSTAGASSIEIKGSQIFATYKKFESHIDLFEKIRVFNGELSILSFSAKMYSQAPSMNLRILAFPTMNLGLEAMIERSTVSIASSTVKTATTKLQQEINKLIETTVTSVHEEIKRRVQLEVECLRETMQMNTQQQIFATLQAGLVGPVNWENIKEQLEAEYKIGSAGGKNDAIIRGKVGNGVQPEAHSAMA